MKYLVQEIGAAELIRLAEAERLALKNKTFEISTLGQEIIAPEHEIFSAEITDPLKYEQWLKTNVFPQKQPGFVAIGLRVQNGDIKTPVARQLISLVKTAAADDIRLTNTQGILLKFVREENLPYVFEELNKLNLAEPGFESMADITSCPGTDTCNLGISNSTGITRELEKVIKKRVSGFDLQYRHQDQNQRLHQFLRTTCHGQHWFPRFEHEN